MRSFLLLTSLLLTAFCAIAHDGLQCRIADWDGRSRDHNVDMLEMDLRLSFDAPKGMVYGNVKYQFSPLQLQVDTLFLDAPNINILGAKLDYGVVHYHLAEDGVVFRFDPPLEKGATHRLEIDYEAQPKKGIYFVGWNDSTQRQRKQIWTQGQGIDNRHWIPSYDHQNDKLITKTTINFDKDYEVVSNGALEYADENGDGTKTWRFKMSKPHASYLVMLAIGDYAYQDYRSQSGVVSRQYYYPKRADQVEPSYKYSAEMMDWMEAEFDVPFPWEINRNVPVVDFLYGAMENTTATILNDIYLRDARAAESRDYVSVNAHELTHQWFGDYITAWSSHDHWLHESFATHYAKHFERFAKGEHVYDYTRWQEIQSALRAGKRDQLPVAHSKAGSARHYPKGSYVLDMLRHVVGDEQYRLAIQHFLKKHAYGSVQSADFWAAFMEQLGINLDWFIDQWITRGGEPHFEISEVHNKLGTQMIVRQTQEQVDAVGYFRMPVDIEQHYSDGSVDTFKVWTKGPVDTFFLAKPEGKNVAYTLFDARAYLLKHLTHERDFKTLKAILNNPKTAALNRFEALRLLKDEKQGLKRATLIEHFEKEPAFYIRAEIVQQLADDKHQSTQDFLLQAINDPHWQVRRAVLQHMNWKKPNALLLPRIEAMLSKDCYTNAELAFNKLSDHAPENIPSYIQQLDGAEGVYMQLFIAPLAMQLKHRKALGLDEATMQNILFQLSDFAGPSFPYRARRQALRAVDQHYGLHAATALQAAELTQHFNRRARNEGKRHFKRLVQADEAHRALLLKIIEQSRLTTEEKEEISDYIQALTTN